MKITLASSGKQKQSWRSFQKHRQQCWPAVTKHSSLMTESLHPLFLEARSLAPSRPNLTDTEPPSTSRNVNWQLELLKVTCWTSAH